MTCVYVILGNNSYHVHIDPGFRNGLSSRTSPAETMRFSLRTRSSSNSCARIFPSFSITLNRESGWMRMPNLQRPFISKRLCDLGPLVTQASAWGMHQSRDRQKCMRFDVQTTIFRVSIPFSDACDFATTSMLRMRLLARFSLNVICKMAESTGFPEI